MVDSTAMRKAFTVPEIKPLDQYDFNRAKICASLGWLLAKAYGNAENVPLDLREPFYRDQYEQEHIKPPVTRLLLSSELYCRAYGQLLGARGHTPSEGPPRDGPSLLRLLAKRAAPPKDRDVPVTDADLRHTPIRMSAHLAVMDALMSAVAMETVSTVKMPGGVDWENAVLYWINRLNQKLKESTEGDPPQISPPSTDLQPVQPSHAIAFCLKESGNKPPVVMYRPVCPPSLLPLCPKPPLPLPPTSNSFHPISHHAPPCQHPSNALAEPRGLPSSVYRHQFNTLPLCIWACVFDFTF